MSWKTISKKFNSIFKVKKATLIIITKVITLMIRILLSIYDIRGQSQHGSEEEPWKSNQGQGGKKLPKKKY